MAGLAAARMSGGSEFHAAGSACEKARSPNLVRGRGVTYLLLWKAIAGQYVLLRCWTYRDIRRSCVQMLLRRQITSIYGNFL